MFQWAKIVVALERAIKKNDAERYLEEYSIALGGPVDESSTEQPQRGVMVIKSKSKTRAKQRKGAVSNWKVRKSGLHNRIGNGGRETFGGKKHTFRKLE